MQPIIRHVEDFSWVFALILVIGVAFVFIKYGYHKLFDALGNPNIFKETDQSAIPLALGINVIVGVLISLLIMPFLDMPHIIARVHWMTMVFMMFGAILFIVLKFLISAIIAYAINDIKDFNNLIKGKIYYRIYWIVFLVLCALLLYFSQINQMYILYAFLLSLVVLLLIEYYQALNQGNLYRYINSYYFILYLCILEIFPVLYIYNHWYG